MVPSLPLLSCESSVSVKENPDRKKKIVSGTHISKFAELYLQGFPGNKLSVFFFILPFKIKLKMPRIFLNHW